MSDTPETDAETFSGAITAELGRKLERQRDEARRVANYWILESSKECTLAQRANKERDKLREEMESEKRWAAQYKQERDKWADTAAQYSLEREHNACYAKQMEAERDEARKEVETLETRHAAVMLHSQGVVDENTELRAEVERLEALYEAMKREKNDCQEQRDNIRLEADQLSTELYLERFSLKEMNAKVEQLKADKARLERALRQANDCFHRIEDTRWGYDGDCGVVAIANEGSDLIESAIKGAE